MGTKFTISEAIGFGWEKMKKNFWFFAGLLAIVWLVQVIPTGFANLFKGKMPFLYFLFIVGAWIVQILVRMGLIKITLDIIDKGKSDLKTLFSQSQLLIKFILGLLVYIGIVLAGLILLIVPGIIWGIKYQFFAYLIIDKNMSPMDAIKKSGEMTMGKKADLFFLGLILILINIAGAICFFVGLFVTIPISMLATAYVYRKLMGEPVASETATSRDLPASTEI